MYKELKKNKNNLQKYSYEKWKQIKHVEARTCAPSAHSGYGSRSDTIPRVGRRHLCCKNSCHKSTSMMVDENDVARSGGQAVPQMGSTGGRSHISS